MIVATETPNVRVENLSQEDVRMLMAPSSPLRELYRRFSANVVAPKIRQDAKEQKASASALAQEIPTKIEFGQQMRKQEKAAEQEKPKQTV